ncbi:hypothetical protein LEMLEM_LOCUS22113 [Lemmus lemmus]
MHDRRFLLFKKDVGQLLESPKFPPEGWEQEFCFTLQNLVMFLNRGTQGDPYFSLTNS